MKVGVTGCLVKLAPLQGVSAVIKAMGNVTKAARMKLSKVLKADTVVFRFDTM